MTKDIQTVLSGLIQTKASELAKEHDTTVELVLARTLQQRAAESLIDYKPNEVRNYLAELFWGGTKGYSEMSREELLKEAIDLLTDWIEEEEGGLGEQVGNWFESYADEPWGSTPDEG